MAKENDHMITSEIFVIRRSFDAPRHLVFAAFTDPEHLIRWWAPKGYTMVYCKRDLRPGGMFHYCAQSPEGNAVWGQFEYRKIVEGHRIIFLHSYSDEYGTTHSALHHIIFTEQKGKTTINLTSETIANQLEAYLTGTHSPVQLNKIA